MSKRIAITIAFICLHLSTSSRAANLTPHGDFESGNRGDRPAEYWHRAGRNYLSAFPDWRLTDKQKANGRSSITTDTAREFVVCGEGQGGQIKGSVSLRAAKPGTKVHLRLSWYDRLNRADTTLAVSVGPEWKRHDIRTEALRGQPMEIAVRSDKAGVRIWADDFRIDGTPVADQFIDRVYENKELKERPFRGIRPRPLTLERLQAYRGAKEGPAGQAPLSVDVPKGCVEVPCVSGGVPFPVGTVYRAEQIAIFDSKGREVPSQVNVLSRWPSDDSIMVALVTVHTPGRPTEFVLRYGPKVRRLRPPYRLPRLKANPAGYGVPHPQIELAEGGVLQAAPTPSREALCGPLRRDICTWGDLHDGTGKKRGRYATRLTEYTGAPRRTLVSFCWINDRPDPSLPVRSARLDFGELRRLAGNRTTQVALDKRFHASREDVVRPQAADAIQKRADGRLAGYVAVRDFWQNHPMAVEWRDRRPAVWLWPDTVQGVFIPQGLARQWEFLVDADGKLTRPFQTSAMPVLRASAEWMCASGVFEHVMPPDPKTFPIFEKRVGQAHTLGRFSLARKESGGLYGVFNYGDAPGDGGWANLESMAAHELFLHWARKPSREHFDMARLAAEHYRDVDIHHGAGFCHTHCNNHVASTESWSHSWVQGVRDLYFLLGDLRALEVLQEVGDRLATKPPGFTTGRDWTRPIDNLVDIYAATGDARYLKAVKDQLAVLRKRQLPQNAVCGAERHSWYEDRYAAGCAFTWYGCQAMAKLHCLTGDPAILDTLRREIDLSMDVQTKSLRSMRILPTTRLTDDHAASELGRFALGRGSTLFPPLGYLAGATGEKRYLDFGMNVLAHYMLSLRGGSDAAATSYATVFLNHARQAGVGPADEAAAFKRAIDFSYERRPKGVANGGFETDAFKHWNVKRVPGQDFYYDKLVRVGYYLDGKVNRSGKRSLRLHSDNRLRVMSVTGSFAFPGRRRYRASLWVKADKTMNPRFSLALREYDTDRRASVRLRPTGKTADGWAEHAGEFSTGERTVATVSLGNRKGTGDVWYDDVAVEDLGRLHSLLTNNGGGRDWDKRPPHPSLIVDTGGTYLPDKKMAGDTEPEGTPIPFTRGALTDGASTYDYRQKPRIAYCYWKGRPQGSIQFDLKRACAVRRVRVNVLFDHKRRTHGTQRIELRLGDEKGKLLGAIDPAQNGWNEFKDLNVKTRCLTLVLTRYKNHPYLTLSEVEVWGER